MNDSKTPPQAFGNAAICSTDPKVVAQAFALLQQLQGNKKDRSTDNCLNCGKKGHWSRDCPDKKRRPGPSRPGRPARTVPPTNSSDDTKNHQLEEDSSQAW
jgi:hypothetical protein